MARCRFAPGGPLRGVARWMGGLGLLASSATGCAQGSAATDLVPGPSDVPQLSEQDLSRHWVQLANPSLALDSTVFGTPLGWFSLSVPSYGSDGKSASHWRTNLYHSEDGVSWSLVHLPLSSPQGDLRLADVLFADGRLVLVGSWAMNGATVLVGRSGEPLARHDVDGSRLPQFARVSYAGGRFFALSLTDAYVSPDGARWTHLSLGEALLPSAVAYGNSTYLLVGNGGLAVSPDAQHWQRSTIDCSLQTACLSSPGGDSHDILGTAFFAEGMFYSNSLRSTDGLTWEQNDGLAPTGRLGDYFVAGDDAGWHVWQPGRAPVLLDVESFPRDQRGLPINPGVLADVSHIVPTAPPTPETASFPRDDGESCATSACIVLDGRLYLAR